MRGETRWAELTPSIPSPSLWRGLYWRSRKSIPQPPETSHNSSTLFKRRSRRCRRQSERLAFTKCTYSLQRTLNSSVCFCMHVMAECYNGVIADCVVKISKLKTVFKMHVIWYHVKLLKVCLCRIFEHVLLLILNGNSLYICYKLPSKHGKVIFLHKTYALDLFNFYLGGRAKVNICGNSTLFLFDFVGIQMNKFSQICLRTPPPGQTQLSFCTQSTYLPPSCWTYWKLICHENCNISTVYMLHSISSLL